MSTPEAASVQPTSPGDDRVAESLLPVVQRLELLLEAELDALRSGETSELLAAVAAKQALLRTLDAQIRASGLDPQAGVATGSAAWTRLTERLARCRSLNLAAGGAIAHAARHVALGLELLGCSGPPVAYSAEGRTPAPPRSRSLAVC